MTRLLLALTFVAAACGSSNPPPAEPDPEPVLNACVKGGCSSTLCIEEGEDVMTTCEWRPEYACYQTAICERQPDGACGWTATDELTSCLASPPAE